MISAPPKPTKRNVLDRMRRQLKVSAVVDVGIREQTIELIQAFPGIPHFLFEPMRYLEKTIRANYAGLTYSLDLCALSDEDTEKFLIERSATGNGIISHGLISQEPVNIDGSFVINCTKIAVRRFDSLPTKYNVPDDFLLKIDVDGSEMDVLRGFGEEIRRASAVVIECTAAKLVERSTFVSAKGFRLIDIVDLVYYGDCLWQFDLVFVRDDLFKEPLKPPTDKLHRALWRELTFG